MRLSEAITLVASVFAATLVLFITLNLANHRKATEDLLQPPSLLRDYQIEVDNDSIYVWDGTREVGSVPRDTSKLDSILLRDNQ